MHKRFGFVSGLVLSSLLTGCGMMESGPGFNPDVTTGEQEFERSYRIEKEDCVAEAKVIAATAEDAEYGICEAASDDKRNNYCAPYERSLFLIQNCDNRGELPTPQPKPSPTPAPNEPAEPASTHWTSERIAQFDKIMSKADLTAGIIAGASRTDKFVANRIADCGLATSGPLCLDADDYFGETQLITDEKGDAIVLAMKKVSTSYFLRITEEKIKIERDGIVIAVISIEKAKYKFPVRFHDYVGFYHRAKRALDHAHQETIGHQGISCPKCEILAEMRASLKKTLNQDADLAVEKMDFRYEGGLLTLAFDNLLKSEDLQVFARTISVRGIASGFGKALVLDNYPRMTGLRADVIDWVKESRSSYRALGIKALGKTELSADEITFIITQLDSDRDSVREAFRILNEVKLAEAHIEPILQHATFPVAVSLLSKIDAVRAVVRVFRLLIEQPAIGYRVHCAYALHSMSVNPEFGERTRSVAATSIRVLKKSETNPLVLQALDGI